MTANAWIFEWVAEDEAPSVLFLVALASCRDADREYLLDFHVASAVVDCVYTTLRGEFVAEVGHE